MRTAEWEMRIGASQSEWLLHDPGSTRSVVQARVGVEMLKCEFLRDTPPTPRQLEEAIACLEDALGPVESALRSAGQPGAMACGHAGLPALLREAGEAGGVLTLEGVERLFQRIAGLAEGRPVRQDPALAEPETVALALFLREAMHHLRLARVVATAA